MSAVHTYEFDVKISLHNHTLEQLRRVDKILFQNPLADKLKTLIKDKFIADIEISTHDDVNDYKGIPLSSLHDEGASLKGVHAPPRMPDPYVFDVMAVVDFDMDFV